MDSLEKKLGIDSESCWVLTRECSLENWMVPKMENLLGMKRELSQGSQWVLEQEEKKELWKDDPLEN